MSGCASGETPELVPVSFEPGPTTSGSASSVVIPSASSTSGTDAAEKRLGGGTNEFVDWLSPADLLSAQGAAASRVRGIYRLVHCATEADVARTGADH